VARVNSSTLKALDVLALLAAAENGLRPTDIAKGTSFPVSTARRLLVSPIEGGPVERDAGTSRYYLGILSDTSVVYVESLAPVSSFPFHAPPGTQMPVRCTAKQVMAGQVASSGF
jgi:DNA-binding IclR family transcriptional regulator